MTDPQTFLTYAFTGFLFYVIGAICTEAKVFVPCLVILFLTYVAIFGFLVMNNA